MIQAQLSLTKLFLKNILFAAEKKMRKYIKMA